MTNGFSGFTRRDTLKAGAAAAFLSAPGLVRAADLPDATLLNVSYDPTRELYKNYNPVFIDYWKRKTGQKVSVEQSHGGSGKQALSVLSGLAADVVTLGISADIDVLAAKGHLLPDNWQTRLPNHSTPYFSTVVFLVRAGNPKKIKTWDDLLQPGLDIITPNPKTSSGGRWNYIAAYIQALRANGGSEAKARDYLARLYRAVSVLDTGARGSTTTFVQRKLGDVLLAWENEAFLALEEVGAGQVEIVVPPISVLAEPPVAWIDNVTEKKGTSVIAKAYLEGLYSEKGQDIIGQSYYRPSNKKIFAKYASRYPKVPLVNVQDFGGWPKLQPAHFGDGGIFDQIYKARAGV